MDLALSPEQEAVRALAYCLVPEELGRGDASVRGYGYGYVGEFPVGKYRRDARVSTLYEGTSQILRLLIGRAPTGVSAF
jgi:alkylation response protein AidB-like acyl-CoA dehydrogenase